MTSRERPKTSRSRSKVINAVAPARFLLPDWQALVGAEAQLASLQKLVKADTLPQVLLIEGREGLGKRRLAAALAAMHFCATRSACGHCRDCQWVLSGEHPELMWIEVGHGEEASTTNLLSADAERFQEHLALQPGSGAGVRIAVLADADRLVTQAANRLLKTLEEPPPAARLILTTSRIGAIMPTILSRCVRWHVPPPPADATRALIKAAFVNAGEGEPGAGTVERILRMSGLAPERALAMCPPEGGAAEDEVDLEPFMMARSASDIVVAAEDLARNRSLTAHAVLQAWEIQLNNVYRHVIAEQESIHRPQQVGPEERSSRVRQSAWYQLGPVALRRRRQILREAKQLAGRGKVPLNAQLTAESLAFTTSI